MNSLENFRLTPSRGMQFGVYIANYLIWSIVPKYATTRSSGSAAACTVCLDAS